MIFFFLFWVGVIFYDKILLFDYVEKSVLKFVLCFVNVVINESVVINFSFEVCLFFGMFVNIL